MRVTVRVIPKAKKNIVKEEPNGLKVYLTAPAIEGKANKALISCLADHFEVKKNRVQIIKGLKSRDKTINIDGI